MPNPKLISIHPTIYKTLLEKKDSLISIKDFKAPFLEIANIKITEDDLTKPIYRQLFRLTQLKLLEKKPIENSKHKSYSITKLFNSTEFKFKTFKFEQNYPVAIDNKLEQHSNIRTNDLLHKLTSQITQYEVDFQSSIAESEEYKRLFTIAPDMKKTLETYFLEARNKSNQLLGKITAVKNVIATLESSNQQCN